MTVYNSQEKKLVKNPSDIHFSNKYVNISDVIIMDEYVDRSSSCL